MFINLRGSKRLCEVFEREEGREETKKLNLKMPLLAQEGPGLTELQDKD